MIASDIWCFRAIAAIGSLPRMTSITISYRFSTVQRLGLGIVPRPARMNCSPPPRCGKAAEAPLKNAPLQQLFHNVLVQIEIHLSLLCALNRSNSKTVPNFLGRDKPCRRSGPARHERSSLLPPEPDCSTRPQSWTTIPDCAFHTAPPPFLLRSRTEIASFIARLHASSQTHAQKCSTIPAHALTHTHRFSISENGSGIHFNQGFCRGCARQESLIC